MGIRITIFICLLAVFCLLSAEAALGQAEICSVEASWAPPTTGTRAVMYHVWVRSRLEEEEDFGDWKEWFATTEPSQVLEFESGRCYEVKVRAEDTAQILGPFSIPSAEFCCGGSDIGDLGEGNQGPGAPGQPFRID